MLNPYRLVENLNEPGSADLKETLTKYDSLLYHTGIQHTALDHLAPLSTKNSLPLHICRKAVTGLPLALIRLIAFMPPLLLYIPGYASAFLATKALAHPAEEEAHAQFRAVVGGMGIGANIAGMLAFLWNSPNAPSAVRRAIFGEDWMSNKWQQIAHGLAASYLCMRILSKWHKLLFKGVPTLL